MFYYRLKIFLFYLFIILIAILIAVVPLLIINSLLVNVSTLEAIQQLDNPSLTFGIAVLAVIAPIFAILESLVSWLKLWRENRINHELIIVVEAQSTSPKGMDIFALERETKLPRKILQERVNELILRGRIGVKLTPNNNREYYLA